MEKIIFLGSVVLTFIILSMALSPVVVPSGAARLGGGVEDRSMLVQPSICSGCACCGPTLEPRPCCQCGCAVHPIKSQSQASP